MSRWAPRALIALACLAAYGPSLGTTEFFHDDQALIAENPLLRGGLRAAPRLLLTGYWEAVRGQAATVQEYRPVLMLSFLAQAMTTGISAPAMHAANLLLHALACLLLYEILGRKKVRGAFWGALLYAVLPVHAEAVSMLTGRSELLCAVLLLSSWLLLDPPPGSRGPALPAGACLYSLALLTKESGLLFPLLLALSDWTFRGQRPWAPERRGVHAALWSLSAAYLLLRGLLLTRLMHGGVPYFTSAPLVKALTLSRFWALHYLWPSLSGQGLCSDFSRPLIPDSSPGAAAAWACLAALALALSAGLFFLFRRRAAWAFWLLGPLLFLLPTSHALFALDRIGAERFLYLPTIGLAAGLGWLLGRLGEKQPLLGRAAAAGLSAWYLLGCWKANEAYASSLAYYQAAADCNPVSARARSALGVSLLSQGRPEQGKAQLLKALELDPALSAAHYNLARLAWENRDLARAEALLRRALDLDPRLADAWALLGNVHEARGELGEADSCLGRALAIWPWHPVAHFNLGRIKLMRAEAGGALFHFTRFLELAPDDPEAGAVAELVLGLRRAP